MNWWEIPQNTTCLFALDSNSRVEGSKIYFSNISSNFLYSEGNALGKVFSYLSSGFLSSDFKNDYKKYNTYRSLKISDSNLIFNKSIPTPDKTTWILKCKVLGRSVFSQGPTTATHGLTWDPTTESTTYSLNWRANSINTGGNFSLQERNQVLTETIHTVMVVTDSSAKSVKFFTDYGEYTEPLSSAYFSTTFGSIYNLTKIGYDVTEWRPKVEIIAYGFFEGLISKEDFNSINNTIEEEFLVESSSLSFNTRLDYNREDFLYKNNSQNSFEYPDLDLLLASEPFENSKAFINQVKIKSDIVVNQTLYKEFEHIHDKVLEEGLPVEVKLYLYERNTGVLIKTTFSDTEGNFSFFNLNKDLEYFITANDNKYQFQSVLKNYNN